MQFTVLTTSKSKAISSGLSYSFDKHLSVGTAVSVPLRNKVVEGVILAKEVKKQTDYKMKSISKEHGTLLTQSQIKTLHWMSAYYCCSLRQCLSVFLPSISWQTLLDYSIQPPTVYLEDLRVPMLTEDQSKAYLSVLHSTSPSLLYGVTGSGKTAIYQHLIQDALRQGKQVIYLVPEILLTQEFIYRLEEAFPSELITVWHSRLTSAQKRKAWQAVHSGTTPIVLGSRSALFAPCQNLGLLIVDEEHEWTYKSERAPRYHVRETAEKLCQYANAKLVLGSATPSLESWHRSTAKKQYNLVELSQRFENRAMPTVSVVDLAQTHCGYHYPLSPELIAALKSCLDRGEQSVLFLNRRGSASSLLCLSCRRRIVSAGSNLPYTVHKMRGKEVLLDHTTGEISDTPSVCPTCLSPDLKAVGAGTQKIEELLDVYFPSARVLRADKDTLKHPEHMRLLLKNMREGQADILLGTQSVVKGLDLPNVTLAAVLVADVGMSLPHFRASERSFQLLSQLTGRSGRSLPGQVIIQTFRPDALEVVSAAKHDARAFLDLELRLREKFNYPPYTSIIRLIARGSDAERLARETMAMLKDSFNELHCSVSKRLFNPTEWQLLIRCNSPEVILGLIDTSLFAVDRDPIDTL